MEAVCTGLRQALSGKSIPCDHCKQIAAELRAHADWLTPKAPEGKTPVEMVKR